LLLNVARFVSKNEKRKKNRASIPGASSHMQTYPSSYAYRRLFRRGSR
jgi:hypothetical protein